MAVELETILSAAGVLIGILSFFYSYFMFVAKLQERIGKLEARVLNVERIEAELHSLESKLNTLDKSCGKVEMQVNLIWQAVEDNITKLLHSPVHKEKDELLEKFPNLNTREAEKLKNILTKEMNTKNKKDPLRLAYALLIARIKTMTMDGEKIRTT